MAVVVHRLPDRDGETAGADSLAFEVTTPVVLHVLDAEITAAHGWRNPVGLVAEGVLATASPENPITVWTMRGDVDPKKFAQVVADHDPVVADPLKPLRDKIHSDDDLTAEEIQQVIKLLAKRAGI